MPDVKMPPRRQDAPKCPAPKQKKNDKPPFKLPSPLVTTFLIVSLLAMAIIIGQCLKRDDSKNIMGLFETESPEYNTDATAELADPITGMVYAKFDDSTKHLSIDSANGILIDLNTNRVVAHKGGNERIYPASMTKLMTLIVAYENSPDLDATFTMTQKICDDAYIAGASVAGFMPGEQIPVIDLLYGTALPSGADATSALAQMIAGSEEGFAHLMNDKVKQLGLENTHFVTASGLHDDDHYSTCHDMAKILEYAISIPKLREILSTYTYTTRPTSQHPEGIMLFNTMNTAMNNTGISPQIGSLYIQGGKTGFTNEAHYCLASFAAYTTKENADVTNPQFILVTAGGIGQNAHVMDAPKAYRNNT